MIRPVILCGGAGTRLWPVSRQLFPKQLLPLMGEKSLLQQTASRLSGEQFAPAIIVSSEDQRVLIKSQLEQVGAPFEAILLEPMARNTSAAAALAAAWSKSVASDELLLLVPSDHVILNRDALLAAISTGAADAETGAIVTFGAQPTEPNTQFGYIEARIGKEPGGGAVPIARFVEKPDAQKAAEYLATGRFYWNTGIFLLKASTLLEEMRKFLPDSLHAITKAMTNSTTDDVFIRPEAEAFNRAANISIDHGIMEKTSRGMVVPVEMDWSDVGSWDAVWKLEGRDPNDNATRGDVMVLDTHSSLLRSEEGGPLVTAVGLDHMAVIATRDAVFVSPLSRVSDVKDIVGHLSAQARECVISHSTTVQPWDLHESIADRSGCQIKRIVLNPGEQLSDGGDIETSAHWIVVRGVAEATIGEQVSIVQEEETAFVPARARRRLANPGTLPLEVVEIQYHTKLD
ncbi:mannose-1-phosphate guanylyltransferase/mannose-6-phosphate isomerase [Sphingomonas agri]|uniref:mannose-1-phosphate guanylyltransferase/mannose-6-phosphate isomerase n=1 Tax=Sphingomonas agri TaxID=1813878 RepID=UPI00311F5B8B